MFLNSCRYLHFSDDSKASWLGLMIGKSWLLYGNFIRPINFARELKRQKVLGGNFKYSNKNLRFATFQAKLLRWRFLLNHWWKNFILILSEWMVNELTNCGKTKEGLKSKLSWFFITNWPNFQSGNREYKQICNPSDLSGRSYFLQNFSNCFSWVWKFFWAGKNYHVYSM